MTEDIVNRIDAKVALVAVMNDAKAEFMRNVARECSGALLTLGTLLAGAAFLLGLLVGTHL